MDQVCLVCMSPSVPLVNIFGVEGSDKPSLADMLHSIINVQVTVEDTLPKQMCKPCIVKLQSFCDIQKEWKLDGDFLDTLEAKLRETVDQHTSQENVPEEQLVLKRNPLRSCRSRFAIIPNTHVAAQVREESKTTSSHKCKTCGKVLTRKYGLTVHNRIHTGDRPYKCSLCPKAFTTAPYLGRHTRIHVGEGPSKYFQFSLRSCRSRFAIKRNTHVAAQVREESKTTSSHKCKTCGKVLTRKYGLTLHNRIHTGERPYKCSLCPKAFIDARSLVPHTRMHTGERPSKCAQCPKAFISSSSLNRHTQNVHSSH